MFQKLYLFKDISKLVLFYHVNNFASKNFFDLMFVDFCDIAFGAMVIKYIGWSNVWVGWIQYKLVAYTVSSSRDDLAWAIQEFPLKHY